MRHSKLKHHSLVSLLALVLTACGLMDPKFEDYEAEDTEDTDLVDATSDCGVEALAIFKENVGDTVSSTCAKSGCHQSGAGAAVMKFTASEDAANRLALYNYTKFSIDKLEAKFKGAHTGGNLSAKVTKDQVDTWLTKEKACLEEI